MNIHSQILFSSSCNPQTEIESPKHVNIGTIPSSISSEEYCIVNQNILSSLSSPIPTREENLIEDVDFLSDDDLSITTSRVDNILLSFDNGVINRDKMPIPPILIMCLEQANLEDKELDLCFSIISYSLFLGKHAAILSNQIVITLLNLYDSRIAKCTGCSKTFTDRKNVVAITKGRRSYFKEGRLKISSEDKKMYFLINKYNYFSWIENKVNIPTQNFFLDVPCITHLIAFQKETILQMDLPAISEIL